jgi:N-acylneuraminate cytidylyltransferase
VQSDNSQDLEPCFFFENGLLYINKAKLIVENKIISENAFNDSQSPYASIDIDTQDSDFEYGILV